MLRTASSLPLAGLLTLGFDPTRFQMKPPACYRATWQLPEPDSHRQATTSLRTANHLQRQPPAPLDARKIEARLSRLMSYLNNLVIWVLCMTRFEICGQCYSRAGRRCQVPGVSVKTGWSAGSGS